MSRDIGRNRAYRAEALAFGGNWYDLKCKSPLLTEEQARAFHIEVATYLKEQLKIGRPLPGFEITKSNHSFFRFSTCHYRLKKLRACVVMHEVAHWAARDNKTTSHGPEWQQAFALAIAKFADRQTADMFLRLCQELPIMRVAAGPKRRWILQEQDRSTREWHNSNRSRKQIPNHQKLAMWRGNHAWVEYPGERFLVIMRMVRDTE